MIVATAPIAEGYPGASTSTARRWARTTACSWWRRQAALCACPPYL